MPNGCGLRCWRLDRFWNGVKTCKFFNDKEFIIKVGDLTGFGTGLKLFAYRALNFHQLWLET